MAVILFYSRAHGKKLGVWGGGSVPTKARARPFDETGLQGVPGRHPFDTARPHTHCTGDRLIFIIWELEREAREG